MELSKAVCEQTFDDLQKIVTPIAKKHGMIRVYLFGSRAREDSDEDSDFDFCIVAPKEYGFIKLGSFLSDLRDALWAGVEIVCEEDLQERPHFMEEVLRDRKVVFEA
jgi:predicted nucleotidyltransferase